MKIRILAFLVLPCLLAACSSGPVLPTEEEAKAVIKEKLSTAAERWANSDPKGYVEMGAPDQTYMDDIAASELLIGSESILAYMENLIGNVPVHKAELSHFHWQFFDDIIVVTYWYTGIFDGEPANPWKVTSVWRYLDDDWLSVHENRTLVKMPKPEAGPAEEEVVQTESIE